MSDSTGALGPLQTEFEFTLPKGFADGDGTLHREGTMRLATAADEIRPLGDRRVRANPSYLTVVLLSRVVTELGTLPAVTPDVIEELFVADIAHLQELYERINGWETTMDVVCPDCGEAFEATVASGVSTRTTATSADAGTGDDSGAHAPDVHAREHTHDHTRDHAGDAGGAGVPGGNPDPIEGEHEQWGRPPDGDASGPVGPETPWE